MYFFQSITALLSLFVCLFDFSDAYTNPIRNPGGSDPFLVYTGGYYYLLTTSWNDVQISRATSIDGLKSATKKVVYSSSAASRCCNVWAPEVHYLGGAWYIYYTAGTSENLDGQRLHVLKGGATPWDTYSYAGQLTNEWSIDGSVLRFNNYGNWLMFSCFHGVQYQSICIQKLSDSYTSLTGSIYVISQPTLAFERNGTPVNEAPTALYFNGKTHVAYAASYCWTPNYCMGLLTWDGTTTPHLASAWSKNNGCVFSSANGNYGPASNGFFQSPDTKETWLVYHATSNSAGACDDSRYTMVQPVTANSNGGPSFGIPAPFSQSFKEPTR